MAIDVTCPGCQKKFKVSDQFAGKKGPCPGCKTVITIPQKGPEVIIHAPDTEGPKDSSGRPVLRPLSRKETKVTPVLIGMIVGGAVLAIGLAIVVRITFPNPNVTRQIVLGLGALLLGPPLVFGGYTFLRDQELEPYRGRAIMLRVAICTAIYAFIWGLFAWVPDAAGIDRNILVLAILFSIMVFAGGLTAYAALDLPTASAAMHYGLYLLVTIVLCLIANVQIFDMTPPSRVPPSRVPKRNPRAASSFERPVVQPVIAQR